MWLLESLFSLKIYSIQLSSLPGVSFFRLCAYKFLLHPTAKVPHLAFIKINIPKIIETKKATSKIMNPALLLNSASLIQKQASNKTARTIAVILPIDLTSFI